MCLGRLRGRAALGARPRATRRHVGPAAQPGGVHQAQVVARQAADLRAGHGVTAPVEAARPATRRTLTWTGMHGYGQVLRTWTGSGHADMDPTLPLSGGRQRARPTRWGPQVPGGGGRALSNRSEHSGVKPPANWCTLCATRVAPASRARQGSCWVTLLRSRLATSNRILARSRRRRVRTRAQLRSRGHEVGTKGCQHGAGTVMRATTRTAAAARKARNAHRDMKRVARCMALPATSSNRRGSQGSSCAAHLRCSASCRAAYAAARARTVSRNVSSRAASSSHVPCAPRAASVRSHRCYAARMRAPFGRALHRLHTVLRMLRLACRTAMLGMLLSSTTSECDCEPQTDSASTAQIRMQMAVPDSTHGGRGHGQHANSRVGERSAHGRTRCSSHCFSRLASSHSSPKAAAASRIASKRACHRANPCFVTRALVSAHGCQAHDPRCQLADAAPARHIKEYACKRVRTRLTNT